MMRRRTRWIGGAFAGALALWLLSPVAEAAVVRVFEGEVDAVDSALAEKLSPGWVFAGSLSLSEAGLDAGAGVEFTVDDRHIVEWEGRSAPGRVFDWRATVLPGTGEAALHLRWALEHRPAGAIEERPAGWLELWFATDDSAALGGAGELTGFFRVAVFDETTETWAFAVGGLFSPGLVEAVPDPAERERALEGVIRGLRADLAATEARLAESEERLRATREQQRGMVSTIEFLASEKQRLQDDYDRLMEELALREALPETVAQLEAKVSLLDMELEAAKATNLRLAEALAMAEAARLREAESRQAAERRLEALPAFTVGEPTFPPYVPNPRAARAQDAEAPAPVEAPVPDELASVRVLMGPPSPEAFSPPERSGAPSNVRPILRRGSLRR